MKIEEILQLVDSVSNSALAEFKFEEGGVKLSLKKAAAQGVYIQEAPMAVQAAIQAAGQSAVLSGNAGMQPAITGESSAAGEGTAGDTANSRGKIVKSPLVGTFYSASSEDAAPYVSVGDSVEEGQVLAIVEAMKLMNDIESEFSGTVAEILVQNGEAVEYGQPLFVIN